MIVCITEKPSVGADIAKILGATTRRDGYFEGAGYCVTWTFGHLCTLKEPADYDPAWRRWSLSQLPMIPQRFGIKLIADKGIEKQFGVIQELISKADEVINCGDAGQEGELIQRWVMQKAGCRIPVKRLWISSLTDEAIREGFKNLRPQEDLKSLYEAGLCRAIGDWILGINATRLYSMKYGADRKMLSVGRVQTPTLALVVKRQQEIEISDGLPGLKDLPFVVTDVTKKKGTEAPPRLFDLTSLQVEANKKYGYGADDTLKAIQSLYEKKVATYPRVDTTYLTDDIYPKCGQILIGLKDYALLVDPLKGARLKKSKKVFDNSKVTDHHAIIPTGRPLPDNLSEMERRVFDLIAKRFISVFYPDCSFEQTTVMGEAGKTKFKAGGKVILNPGWKNVYARESKVFEEGEAPADADLDTSMPAFVKGESGPHKPQLAKRTSQPPKYYTEGTLLKAMETAG